MLTAVKLLEFLWVIDRDEVQRDSGNLYRQFTDSVQFAIPTFGRPMNRYYQVNDINLWGKRLVRLAILSDSTTPCGSEWDA